MYVDIFLHFAKGNHQIHIIAHVQVYFKKVKWDSILTTVEAPSVTHAHKFAKRGQSSRRVSNDGCGG